MAGAGIVFTEDFLEQCFLFLDVLGLCIIKRLRKEKGKKKESPKVRVIWFFGPNKNLLSRPTFEELVERDGLSVRTYVHIRMYLYLSPRCLLVCLSPLLQGQLAAWYHIR